MIINPWIFYVINILLSLEGFLIAMIWVAILAIVALGIGVMSKKEEIDIKKVGDVSEKDRKTYNQYISWLKKSIVAFAICSIVIIAIPTQETMYTMLVSSYVTTDNIETVGDVIQDSVDYIFEKLNNEGE